MQTFNFVDLSVNIVSHNVLTLLTLPKPICLFFHLILKRAVQEKIEFQLAVKT